MPRFAASCASDVPAALMVGDPTGGIAIGVLLNEGNLENAYCEAAVVSVGGPLKCSATPCASKAVGNVA